MVKEGADPSGKGSEPDADRHNNNTNCKWVLSALRVVVNGVAGRVVSDVSTPNLIISNTSARVGCINIPRTFIITHEDSGICLPIGLEKPRGVLSRDGLTAWQYARKGEHRNRGLTLPENLYHHDSWKDSTMKHEH